MWCKSFYFQITTYLKFLTLKILKMCDPILVTLIKIQPHNSQLIQCWNCVPIQRHMLISLLLGSTPPRASALKELCHYIHQKPSSRNNHQTEWNIKINDHNIKDGINNTTNTKEGSGGQICRRFKLILGIENLQATFFSKLIFVVCNLWYNTREVNMLDKKLWFCHLQIIFSLTSTFHSQ